MSMHLDRPHANGEKKPIRSTAANVGHQTSDLTDDACKLHGTCAIGSSQARELRFVDRELARVDFPSGTSIAFTRRKYAGGRAVLAIVNAGSIVRTVHVPAGALGALRTALDAFEALAQPKAG